MSLACHLYCHLLNQRDKDSLINIAILLSFEKSRIRTVEWHPVGVIAELKGMTPDGIRKQLKNGDFEEGLDFKYKGARILINQGAVEQIRRKRRSSNG